VLGQPVAARADRQTEKITKAIFVTIVLLASVLSSTLAFADAALLLEEPYGRSGSVDPTGHAAVYLTRICAESPTRLRRCRPGETAVVVSRYHRIGGFDWIAVPLISYLYAVERADEVADVKDARAVATLRNDYRRTHFQELVPDRSDGKPPKGDWIQLIGAAYDRRIVVFNTVTTEEEDDELIAALNGSPNKTSFNLFFRNCADFSPM
jgi:hypothetical protein